MLQANPSATHDPINPVAGDVSELLARIDVIDAQLRAEAPKGETIGRLTPVAEGLLRTNRLLGIFVPAQFGGSDLSPRDALRLLERLFLIDASTAWVAMASNINCSAAAYLTPDVAARHFGEDMPICAGQGAPMGKAERVDGGYRLTGRWQYGSGMLNARFAMAGALVTEGGVPVKDGHGAAVQRLFMLPVEQARLLGNWDVVGLRATGSVDYALEDVFVAEEYAIDMHHGQPHCGEVWQHCGLNGRVLITHTSFAMGLGRRALTELKAFATLSKGGRGCMADSEAFRETYARSEARYRAARALVMESWADIEETLQAGGRMQREQITSARLALTHMTEVAVEVATTAFRYGGGTSLRQGDYQRCFRDALAGGQHIQASIGYYPDCARDLLGIAQDAEWTLFKLVPAAG